MTWRSCGGGEWVSKEKHPSWFKLKLERRELILQLSPETAVNVLLACWDYLETGEKPDNLSPIENVAFASFIPDLKDAWELYLKRIANGANGGRPKGEKPNGTERNHMEPYATEEETETEEEKEVDSKFPNGNRKRVRADKPPEHPRFLPPTVEDVAEYVKQRGSKVDPQGFVDFYEAKGWKIGKTPMKDWKAACRNAEHWERWEKKGADPFPDYSGGDFFG